MKNTIKRVTALVLALIMVFALSACGGKDTDDKKDPDKEGKTENGGTKAYGYDTSEFDGVLALGENGELCVSYPTSVLREDGYGGLESVSDAGIIFTPSIYVYPEGSSSIEGSNKNMSTNFASEKDFSDDLDYTVGDFSCHHVRFINIWDTATHCYLIDTTGLGDKDAAALYIKIEVESDEQLPLVEAILSTLRVNK